jgi:hypothetical protein
VTQRLHHDEIDIGAKATGRQRTLQEIATVAYLSSHNLWEPAPARSGLQDNMRGARRLWLWPVAVLVSFSIAGFMDRCANCLISARPTASLDSEIGGFPTAVRLR